MSALGVPGGLTATTKIASPDIYMKKAALKSYGIFHKKRFSEINYGLAVGNNQVPIR